MLRSGPNCRDMWSVVEIPCGLGLKLGEIQSYLLENRLAMPSASVLREKELHQRLRKHGPRLREVGGMKGKTGQELGDSLVTSAVPRLIWEKI